MVKKLIGTFEVTSGRIVCSDPCYGTNTFGNDIMNMENGRYNIYQTEHDFGVYGVRNTELAVIHQDYDDDDTIFFEDAESCCGVDSGTFGFFDAAYYEETHNGEDAKEDWYQRNVIDTCYDEDGTITDNRGVLASAGFGDGAYELEIAYKDQKDKTNDIAVGVKVIFIDDIENF